MTLSVKHHPKQHFQYIYGPVYSWRMGMSLGIDPVATKEKACNFDCIYCQLGRTVDLTTQRQVFVPVQNILEEIKQLPEDVSIDYLTFSGRGEPTLASNLGEMISSLKDIRNEKIAVITNSALIHDEKVQEELALADFVLLKLDACSQDVLEAVDQVQGSLDFDKLIEGIKSFQKIYKGKLALQMMFIEQNKKFAQQIALLAKEINPDEVQINTPLRPGGAKPLSRDEMKKIEGFFDGLNVISVYEEEKQTYLTFDDTQTALRHGNFKKSVIDE